MVDKAPSMDWTSSNVPETFRLFKQRMELYFAIHPNIKQDGKVATILLSSGEEGIKRFNSWDLNEEERKNPDTIWERFAAQIEPADNFRINRLRLASLRQRSDESLDDFVNRSKLIANKCNFQPDELQQRLIEIIIAATPIPEFQKELLTKPIEFTLNDTIQLGRTYEASLAHINALKSINTPTNTPVDAVRRSRPHYTNTNKIKHKSSCKNCGRDHALSKEACPAAKSVCGACGKTGHWAKLCLTTKYRSRSQSRNNHKQRTNNRKQIHSVDPQASNEENDMNQQLESLSFCHIGMQQKRDEAFANIHIKLQHKPGTHNLKVKVDTGAQANTLPTRIFNNMFPNQLQDNILLPANTTLTAYNGTKIDVQGILPLKCSYDGKSWQEIEFFVVNAPGYAILGLPSSEHFKIVTLHCAVQKTKHINSITDLKTLYPNQFDRIGEFKSEHKLVIDPNVPARINPPRKIPIALRDTIKAELDNMCQQNVIRKIEEPTDWVNSLTYVTKQNGTVRICLDPKHLNKALLRPHHTTPTVDDLNHKFSGAKFFSKLDAKSGYWSVKLHPDSQPLTTFQTPFGRYCFQRLPFGLSVSQDIFQLEMDRILSKCTNACGIADDIIVYGTTEEEHDRHLHNFMNIAEQEGLVLNSEKCTVKSDSVTFFGHVYTTHGIKPDPSKINDLKNMPEPMSKAEIHHFLGFATYLSKFIPDFSSKTAVLRDLLGKDALFLWEKHHQEAFNDIKNAVTEQSTLHYYNPHKPVELHCDASLRGIGAALLQPDNDNTMKPIAFASKSLTPTEQRYACIERELLAIVFGVQRFHTYVFGRHFDVITDHRPLVMILNKPITSAPPRLQRMVISLNGYNFSIQHRPGNENLLADGLSRLPNVQNKSTIDLDIRVDNVNFSEDRITKIRRETCQDPILSGLKDIIITGWPEKISQLPSDIRPYWNFRDQLSMEDGILLNGKRIIIPPNQQKDILTQLHTAHLGIEKTKLLASTSVYWLGINKAIDQAVSQCKTCQQHQKAQTPEPLTPHEIPTRPWSVVATDIFDFNHNQYLIIADYFSKFPIVRKLPQPAPSRIVINIMKQVFSEFGIPDKLVSDNGPHFANFAFKDFANAWQFTHATTSPRRPQGNGFIERQIQTIKSILKKAVQSNTDPALALLHWRSTPITTKLGTPAQLLMGRKLKNTLPIKNHNSDDPTLTEIHDELEKRQRLQKHYFDQHALPTELPYLYVGQPVRTRHPETGQWFPATIIQNTNDPKSYILRDANGSIIRRNRQHIRDIPAASATKTFTKPTETLITPKTPIISNKKHVTFQLPPKQTFEGEKSNIQQTRHGRNIVKPKRYRE